MRKDVRIMNMRGRITVGIRCGIWELAVVVLPDWKDGRGRDMKGVDCEAR